MIEIENFRKIDPLVLEELSARLVENSIEITDPTHPTGPVYVSLDEALELIAWMSRTLTAKPNGETVPAINPNAQVAATAELVHELGNAFAKSQQERGEYATHIAKEFSIVKSGVSALHDEMRAVQEQVAHQSAFRVYADLRRAKKAKRKRSDATLPAFPAYARVRSARSQAKRASKRTRARK